MFHHDHVTSGYVNSISQLFALGPTSLSRSARFSTDWMRKEIRNDDDDDVRRRRPQREEELAPVELSRARPLDRLAARPRPSVRSLARTGGRPPAHWRKASLQ